jgi:hypothetical protein
MTVEDRSRYKGDKSGIFSALPLAGLEVKG